MPLDAPARLRGLRSRHCRTRSIVVALSTAALAACGSGYDVQGALVWRPRHDDAQAHIAIVKSQWAGAATADPTAAPVAHVVIERPLAQASAAARDALANLRTQEAGPCEIGAPIYELALTDRTGTQRYRSANSACPGNDDGQSVSGHIGYIAAEDAQRLAELLAAAPSLRPASPGEQP
ncbi:MAG: hypothetical protein Q4A98_08585 [Comamonadaceae bacterium]|nr:hypothetical protein [Comamonadaceae bacterium]